MNPVIAVSGIRAGDQRTLHVWQLLVDLLTDEGSKGMHQAHRLGEKVQKQGHLPLLEP